MTAEDGARQVAQTATPHLLPLTAPLMTGSRVPPRRLPMQGGSQGRSPCGSSTTTLRNYPAPVRLSREHRGLASSPAIWGFHEVNTNGRRSRVHLPFLHRMFSANMPSTRDKKQASTCLAPCPMLMPSRCVTLRTVTPREESRRYDMPSLPEEDAGLVRVPC